MRPSIFFFSIVAIANVISASASHADEPHEIVVTLGNDKFTYSQVETTYSEDLRVFGYNRNSAQQPGVIIRPASHILMSASMQAAGEVYDKNYCEKDAMAFASLLFIGTDDASIQQELACLAEQQASKTSTGPTRKCAHLEGHRRNLTSFLSNGVDRTNQPLQFRDFKSDPKELIWLTKFEEIPCS